VTGVWLKPCIAKLTAVSRLFRLAIADCPGGHRVVGRQRRTQGTGRGTLNALWCSSLNAADSHSDCRKGDGITAGLEGEVDLQSPRLLGSSEPRADFSQAKF
jgi:hypothetical protein